MIKINNLSKTFKTKDQTVQAVDDVSIDIEKGDIYGVIGYSGAGKSTFVRLINRLEDPTDGEIILNGQDMTDLSKAELRLERQKIGMIFQHFNLLWSRTVYENIAFPLEIAGMSKADRKAKVLELIELVGLKGRENSYPSQLSGGQKQRVGIARSLANDPKVLLCDEATSALDPETTDDILNLLVSINEKLGLTIILITHEMHVIQKICHRVAVMEQGHVVEQGDVLDVFMNPQSKTTRRFVQQLNPQDQDDGDIHEFITTDDHSKVVKLHFIGHNAKRALISDVSKQFDINVNIIQGSISPTQKGAYGTLYVELQGDPNSINQVTNYIETAGVGIEVIDHVD